MTLEVIERRLATPDVPELEDHVVGSGDEVVVVCLAPVHAGDPSSVRCVLGADDDTILGSGTKEMIGKWTKNK